MNILVIIQKILLKILPIYHKFSVKYLRRKKRIKIVFFAMNLPMWKYQNLYNTLKRNSKFELYIVVTPCEDYNIKHQDDDTNLLVQYFQQNNTPYILGIKKNRKYFNLRKEINPDIIFYPQPYRRIVPPPFQYTRYLDKLLCYYPYAFWTSQGEWSYNQGFHNVAWKLFYSTELHQKDAIHYSMNKGKNVEVVGYPNADNFLIGTYKKRWKKQNTSKKRIIWAPHYTIFSGGYLYQSNFLQIAEFMIKLAQRYSDKIQFAFKPHPRLYTELCKHHDWGKEKTEAYYLQWESMENTQLESGEYVDLFMTSDAMIHDSSSFTVEYHYSKNPVMFITNNYEEHLEGKSDFGKLAMEQHYIGKNKEDIIQFIENVVLMGIDPMKLSREDFFNKYLLPPNGKTVVQNTMDVFIKTFC